MEDLAFHETEHKKILLQMKYPYSLLMIKIGIILSRGVFQHLTTQLEGESA